MGWVWLEDFVSISELCEQLGLGANELRERVGDPQYVGPNPYGGEERLYDAERVEKALELDPGAIKRRWPARWRDNHGFK